MNPEPSGEPISMPSTNTLSLTANGAWLYPRIGVLRTQVAIPVGPLTIETIPTPFELLIVMILCGSDSNPNIGASCSISAIDPFGAFATRVVVSTTCLVVSFQRITSGSERYFAPANSISISWIVSKLSTVTIGGTNASGLRVLSAE